MKIIAHRGASGHAPENTLAAFRMAWDVGADGIEMDVRLSRDGRIMVHHDSNTKRTAGLALDLAATDSAKLRELDVGRWRALRFAGERIPFLEEVFDTVPKHGQALVEIKCGPEIVPALDSLLQGYAGLCERIIVISFNLDTLLACIAALPDIPCYLVTSGHPPDDQGRHPPHPLDLIALARTHKLLGLDPSYQGISAEFAAEVLAAKIELITWTVNDPVAARRLHAMGLAAITTDYPAEIRQALSDLLG